MKIVKVEPLLIDRFCFVRIETDEGIDGIGESGAWGHLEASAAAVHRFAEYLVGRDPRRIEHHWNVMIRAAHFTGAAITGAISAIDIALWDIKGKFHGVPVHELLGGKVRGMARVYAHLKGHSVAHLVEEANRLAASGFNAVGHFNPLLIEDESIPYFRTHAKKVGDAIEAVRLVREAVGPQVDLCVEIHRRMTPPEAIALGHGIEPYLPMFIEDPLRPDSFDAMAYVADHIQIPVATGERFVSLHQFQTLLARHGVQYLRPDVCMVGGITAAKKIAAIAEGHDAMIVPHNPLSPVSTAACLQVAACIPNFAIQEYPSGTPGIDGHGGLLGDEIVRGLSAHENGFVPIPSVPGIGVELTEDAEKRFPFKPRSLRMRAHVDGFCVDQ